MNKSFCGVLLCTFVPLIMMSCLVKGGRENDNESERHTREEHDPYIKTLTEMYKEGCPNNTVTDAIRAKIYKYSIGKYGATEQFGGGTVWTTEEKRMEKFLRDMKFDGMKIDCESFFPEKSEWKENQIEYIETKAAEFKAKGSEATDEEKNFLAGFKSWDENKDKKDEEKAKDYQWDHGSGGGGYEKFGKPCQVCDKPIPGAQLKYPREPEGCVDRVDRDCKPYTVAYLIEYLKTKVLIEKEKDTK